MIPCIDCITFPVCNGHITSVVDITQEGIILKLYDRCSLMRKYLSVSQKIKSIHSDCGWGTIDYNKLKDVHIYYKNFKGRQQ